MLRELTNPIIYLITRGSTTAETTTSSPEYNEVLALVRAAVRAKVSLLQIREKNLTDGTLLQLASAASVITRGSQTRLLVNRRADIALASNADGVHLPAQSLGVETVRKTFGESLMIGVSTHSPSEVVAAQQAQADFVVFGPIFKTPLKNWSVGIQRLREATSIVAGFPLLALGGIDTVNAVECFRAGASGVAAIRMFSNPAALEAIVGLLRNAFKERQHD